MNSLACHDFLCECLRPRPREDAQARLLAQAQATDFSWPAVIHRASVCRVSPAVVSGLRRAGVLDAVPADVAEYFEAMHCLNEERNRRILQQIGEAVGALRDCGVEPVLLKSAAHLLSGVYGALGDRFVQDIDLLVAPNVLDSAADCLRRLGYAPLAGTADAAPNAKHLPTLARGAEEVAIEVHRRVSRDSAEPLLSAADVLRDAELVQGEGLRARAPSTVHRMIHHVLHAHVEQRGRWWRIISLRRALEVDALGRRLSERGQWPEVFTTFEQAGRGTAVREYLYAMHQLLGAEVPVRDVTSFRARLAWRRHRLSLRYPGWASWLAAPYVVTRTLAHLCRDGAYRALWARRLRDFRTYGELRRMLLANLYSEA